MNTERRRILDMVSASKISAEEADGLLATLEAGPAASATATSVAAPTAKTPKYLRVMVDGTDRKNGGPLHVNVRIPIALLRAGVRLASVLPAPVQERVNDALRERGVDLDVSRIKPDNVGELIDQLRDFTIDIDHQSLDPARRNEDVTVKVYVE